MRVSSGSTTRVRAARIREKRSTRGWKTTRGRERRRSALPPNAPYAPRNRGVVHQARQDAFFERREALALQQVRHPGVRRRVVLLRGGTGEAVRFRFAEVAFRGDACGGNLQGAARNRSGAALITLLVILRMADADMSLFVKGLAFIVIGLCFLGFNIFISRRRLALPAGTLE